MKKEIRNKWLKALRSGKFKQGQGALRTVGTGHCCLGVLCEVYRQDTGNGVWVKEKDSNKDEKDYEFLSNVADLPREVQKWAGIKSATGYINARDVDGGNIRSLANINDGESAINPLTGEPKHSTISKTLPTSSKSTGDTYEKGSNNCRIHVDCSGSPSCAGCAGPRS